MAILTWCLKCFMCWSDVFVVYHNMAKINTPYIGNTIPKTFMWTHIWSGRTLHPIKGHCFESLPSWRTFKPIQKMCNKFRTHGDKHIQSLLKKIVILPRAAYKIMLTLCLMLLWWMTNTSCLIITLKW